VKGDIVPEGGRVSHVVYCLEGAHVEEALTFWRDGLGAEFESIEIDGSGLRIMFAEEAGVEIIAPADGTDGQRSLASSFLAEHGEGVFGIVYRVRSLDDATEAVGRVGGDVVRRVSFTGTAPWSIRFDALEEAHLVPLHGMRVTLGKIEYKD
jgi:predicted enzyme related to lactoylglutathione lyase